MQDQLAEIRMQLSTGQPARALAGLDNLISRGHGDPNLRVLRGIALRGVGRLDDAVAVFEAVLKAAGEPRQRASMHYEIGFTRTVQRDWERAARSFERAAAEADPHAEICSGLCLSYSHLGALDKARHWGERLLRMRDDATNCDAGLVVPKRRPKPFDPDAPARNVVAYSLFGDDPFYHECAVTMARTTPTIFSEFTARFYCGPEIPKKVLRALTAAKARVLQVGQRGPERLSPYAGTFWRFLAFDDPNVDVVIVRDVDSPILPRERAAIDLWLESEFPFYCLRDHPVHAEVMLAGMWGGFTGVLPKIAPLMQGHLTRDHARAVDQRFLRDIIWPRIREATLAIDSCYSLGNSVDYPPGFPVRGRVHVGMSWNRDQILGKD